MEMIHCQRVTGCNPHVKRTMPVVAGRIDLGSKSGMRENGQKPVPGSRLEVTVAWSWLVTVEMIRKVEF